MVFRSCLCSRKLSLQKLKTLSGPTAYPGILSRRPFQRPLTTIPVPHSTEHSATKIPPLHTSKRFFEKRELDNVLERKLTPKQTKSYFRRLSKLPPEFLADLFSSKVYVGQSNAELKQVLMDAAAYWSAGTIQTVMSCWGNGLQQFRFEMLNSLLLQNYDLDRDIVPLINALPTEGTKADTMPFYNAVLNKCLRCKEYDHVRLVINIMKERHIEMDTASFNILLRMRLLKERCVSGLEVLNELLKEGVAPNHATFNTIIKYTVQQEKWDILSQCLDLMDKHNINPTSVTARMLFRAMCKYPKEREISLALDRVAQVVPLAQTEELLNSGAAALLKANQSEAAMELLKRIFDKGTPNIHSYNLLLQAFCQTGKIEGAQQILSSMITSDNIPEPDIVSFTTVIHGLIRHSDKIDLNQINILYDKMLQAGLHTNNVLQSVILYGLTKSENNSNILKTRSLFNSIMSNKHQLALPRQNADGPLAEINIYNMMMDFYFLHYHKSKTLRNQVPQEPLSLLKEAVEIKKLNPNISTLNIMVKGLAVLNKDLVAAKKIVDLMKDKGVEMDERTLWYLVKTAYRQGQTVQARQWIEDYERSGKDITGSGLKSLKSNMNKWVQDKEEKL